MELVFLLADLPFRKAFGDSLSAHQSAVLEGFGNSFPLADIGECAEGSLAPELYVAAVSAGIW